MSFSPVVIDGFYGEGGGQILRSSLSLSLLTGRPVHLHSIRARRDNPGLRPQHLKAVHAAAAISNARVEGAVPGAMELSFTPQGLFSGAYRFEIETAGSAPLVLQTVLLPLSFALGSSRVVVTGGTHVPWSPDFHFLDRQWARVLDDAGFNFDLSLERAGYYPQGGGQIRGSVEPVRRVRPLRIGQRGNLERIFCLSAVTGLPISIARRQAAQVEEGLSRYGGILDIEVREVAGKGQGTFVLLLAEFENARCCYSALGEKGKPAEQVGDEATESLLNFLRSDATVDEHLADQLLLPLAFADGESLLRTPVVTRHLLTNARTLSRFLPVAVQVDGEQGSPGRIRIPGMGRPD